MTKHQIVFAAMTFILAACATGMDGSEEPKKMSWETDERLGERVDKICFGSNIDGFKQTTRTSVVVSEGRDDYLIETYRGCFDLSSAGSLSHFRIEVPACAKVIAYGRFRVRLDQAPKIFTRIRV